MKGERAKVACSTCGDRGYYSRLPPGVNPFRMRIEQIARSSKTHICSCAAGDRYRHPTGEPQQ